MWKEGESKSQESRDDSRPLLQMMIMNNGLMPICKLLQSKCQCIHKWKILGSLIVIFDDLS